VPGVDVRDQQKGLASQLKETLQAITGVEVRRQTLFGDLIQIPDDNVCCMRAVDVRSLPTNPALIIFPFPAPPTPQKTLASLGVTSGVRFVMVEDDPGSRRTSMLQPHQNPFAMLAGAHGAVCGGQSLR
jgi:hypothetical protein